MENIDVRLPNLLTKLASMKKSELIDPDEEVDPKSEVVIGTLPEDLKRLYTLWQMVKREAEKCEDKLEGDCGKNKCRACEINRKADLLGELFLYSVQDQYRKDLWGPPACPSIGIRKGFLVIKPIKRKGPPLIIVAIVQAKEPFSQN